MKLQAEIDGELFGVELARDGRAVSATIDGREYELDVSQPEPGLFLIKRAGRVFRAAASTDQTGATSIHVGGRAYRVAITDPKRLRSSSSADAHSAGRAEIRTAMPGKVVRLLVSVSDDVAKGDGIIVVEAMKMQNELKAPKDGTITELPFAEGSTVAAGDVLAVIE